MSCLPCQFGQSRSRSVRFTQVSNMAAASTRRSQPERGGYELELFCDPKVPDKLICSICMKVLCQPRLTECCGQHFCESCLLQWAQEGTSPVVCCPHCRQETFVHIRNKALRREIDELRVTCIHCGDVCTWTGSLRELDSHLHDDCGCVEVHCPNGCSLPKVKRRELTAHLQNECYLRKFKCEHCDHEDTYGAITGRFGDAFAVINHYSSDCPNYLLECPNKCGVQNIMRRNMSEHRQRCPLERVECPNKCKTKVIKGRVAAVRAREVYGHSWTVKTTEVPRFRLERHLKSECYLRSYRCVHCGLVDTIQAMVGVGGPWPIQARHRCPEKPCDCPNNCETKGLKRSLLSEHREQCPLEPVACPLAEAGCEARPLRRDLEEHLASNIQQHFLQAFHRMNALKEKCDKLEKQNCASGSQE